MRGQKALFNGFWANLKQSPSNLHMRFDQNPVNKRYLPAALLEVFIDPRDSFLPTRGPLEFDELPPFRRNARSRLTARRARRPHLQLHDFSPNDHGVQYRVQYALRVGLMAWPSGGVGVIRRVVRNLTKKSVRNMSLPRRQFVDQFVVIRCQP